MLGPLTFFCPQTAICKQFDPCDSLRLAIKTCMLNLPGWPEIFENHPASINDFQTATICYKTVTISTTDSTHGGLIRYGTSLRRLSDGSQSYIQIHVLKEMPEQSSVPIQLHSDSKCTYNAHLKWYNIVIIKHNANASTHWQYSLSSVQVMLSAKAVGYKRLQNATNAHQDC